MENTLPHQTDEDIAVQKISLQALGQSWTICRPASLEDLWEQMTTSPGPADFAEEVAYQKGNQHNLARSLTQAFEEDDRIPYWTEVWPAGIALAEWLGEQRKHIENQICLDLGCGLGFTALTGAWLGAKVLAMDYEHQALYYAALNGRILEKNLNQAAKQAANAPATTLTTTDTNALTTADKTAATNEATGTDTNLGTNPVTNLAANLATGPVTNLATNTATNLGTNMPASQAANLAPGHTLNWRPPTWLAADWRRPCFKPGSIKLIWAGDIMYEHRFITPVANFLEHTLAKNGVAWIAEPGRNIYPEFAKTMQNRGWQMYIAGRKQARLPESRAPLVNVQIWQIQKKSL